MDSDSECVSGEGPPAPTVYTTSSSSLHDVGPPSCYVQPGAHMGGLVEDSDGAECSYDTATAAMAHCESGEVKTMYLDERYPIRLPTGIDGEKRARLEALTQTILHTVDELNEERARATWILACRLVASSMNVDVKMAGLRKIHSRAKRIILASKPTSPILKPVEPTCGYLTQLNLKRSRSGDSCNIEDTGACELNGVGEEYANYRPGVSAHGKLNSKRIRFCSSPMIFNLA